MSKRITNLYKIIWILLAGSLFAQTKEGLYSTDKNLIFRETFNSEYDLRRNGGTPTDVSFNQGKVTFNNTSSFINYGDRLNFGLNSFSVRAKARSTALNETGTILAKRAATNNSVGFWITQNNASTLRYSIEIDDSLGNEVLCTSVPIAGNEEWHELVFVVNRALNLSYVYVDGSSVVSADISSVGSINNSVDLLIGKMGAGNFFAGDLDAVKVYNYALTANEVLNLYQNKRYREFISSDEILRVDARKGAIYNKYTDDVIGTLVPSIVNTATTIKRDGSIYVMDFDGSSSKVDCGDYDDLTGDKTFIAWIKPRSLGESNIGVIAYNGQFLLRLNANNSLRGFSDNSTGVVSANNSITLNQWQVVTVTRTSSGVWNYYINGVLSGSADQDSGTPVAGSNIIVGNISPQTQTFDGYISDPRIVDGILTTQEISQLYTSEKQQYGM